MAKTMLEKIVPTENNRKCEWLSCKWYGLAPAGMSQVCVWHQGRHEPCADWAPIEEPNDVKDNA